jgi:hypothetical protein
VVKIKVVSAAPNTFMLGEEKWFGLVTSLGSPEE